MGGICAYLNDKAHGKTKSNILITQNYFRNNEEIEIKLDLDKSFVENASNTIKKLVMLSEYGGCRATITVNKPAPRKSTF